MKWLDRWLKRKPLSSSQESVSETQLVPTNWVSSQLYLALLERFLPTRMILPENRFLDFWAPAFGMSRQRVIDGLIAHGALEHLPLLEKVGTSHTVAELKKMLSSRGLKTSGKKAELIQRLLEADPKGMEVQYAHRMILQCTPTAIQAVARWKAECEKAFEIAADNVIAALRNRDFKEAIRVADVYRKNKFETPIHPGVAAMMIKPASRSLKERANDLATVFTTRPKILNG